jgi:hypothetical protein
MQEPAGTVASLPGIWQSVGTSLVSALLGFLGAVAVFRAKFDVIDAKRDALEKQIERDRESDREFAEREMAELRRMLEASCIDQKESYKRIERRQQINLELIAAIAMKHNVTHRALGVDALARLIGDSVEDDKGA